MAIPAQSPAVESGNALPDAGAGAARTSADAPPPAPRAQAASPQAAKPAKANLPQAGDVFANRYRIEKFLGLGSLCNSYLCREVEAAGAGRPAGTGNREVVLKVMHARKAAEAGLAGSFQFLAQSVAQYQHRGIARIFDVGKHEGQPYYAMEWVSGVPLRMWLLERMNFENRVLPGLGLIQSLLGIFEAIHERGCYGCLKPENVYVTLNGPVVMDFGVVGFLSPQEFEFNSYARRYLPYMAPELKQDWSNLIPQSDYYSLGAILYEILLGRAPAPQLRLPSEMSDEFGIEVDEIILKAMAPKPMDRFATINAFRSAVDSLQAALLNARGGAEAPPSLPPEETASPHLEATSDAHTVHNPDETFASAEPDARTGTPVLERSNLMDGEGEERPWSPAEETADEEEAPRALSQHLPGAEAAAEAAHAQRRFAFMHAPRSVLADRVPEEGPAAPSDPDAETGGQTPPESDAASPESEAGGATGGGQPVPAWLWIAIALAGCSMVVLSAYFGLLLPK